MTPEQMNIAIAEWCECNVHGVWWCDACRMIVDPQHVTFEERHDDCRKTVEWQHAFDPIHDRNVMHEALMRMDAKQRMRFGLELVTVAETYRVFMNGSMYVSVNAIAELQTLPLEQIGEALLRTIGKLEE